MYTCLFQFFYVCKIIIGIIIITISVSYNIFFFQILQLLEGLGLSQYKKKFSSERVTGKILMQCNEKTLEKDLGVSSKLHRMHLMEFIQGSECVYSVIAKQ